MTLPAGTRLGPYEILAPLRANIRHHPLPAGEGRGEGHQGEGGVRLLSLKSPPDATPSIAGSVRVAAGPWSLEEGWWSDSPAERDYWDVELSDGGLYRIFRDRRGESWFADGLYD